MRENKSLLYGNCVMLSPDNVPMCRCDRKKADWYLSRDLADVIQESPLIIKLKFVPKGNGKCDDPYYLEAKENICVCCGVDSNLTKHHCIPRCFRIYFPMEYKSHRSHDVVLLCAVCHALYEPHARDLKVQLARQYNICFGSKREETDLVARDAVKASCALLYHRSHIPEPRIRELVDRISAFLGRPFTDVDLQNIIATYGTSSYYSLGRQVASRLSETEIPKFEQMWREHFVQVMQPKFLPKHWSVNHWDTLSEKR